MTAASQTPGYEQLPASIPVFPLAGVLLLPGGRLPLNLFEPRYLAMTRDAMAGHRVIGMVQPIDPKSREWHPEIYRTGCAGKITACAETPDGRFLITLTGTSRFDILAELESGTPYRQAKVSYERFPQDLGGEPDGTVDRGRLLRVLRAYLEMTGIPADWKAVERAPSGPLITSLAMICPFEPSEKQALLETATLSERARVMIALIEMTLLQQAAGRPDSSLQ